MSKKILSIVIAIVMLVGALSVGAYALPTVASGLGLDPVLQADDIANGNGSEATPYVVAAGQDIDIYLYWLTDTATWGNPCGGAFGIAWDSTMVSAKSTDTSNRVFLNEWSTFYKAASGVAYTNLDRMTGALDADESTKFDTGVWLSFFADTAAYPNYDTEGCGSHNNATPKLKFTLTVDGSLAAGTTFYVGVPATQFTDMGEAYFCSAGNGADGGYYYGDGANDDDVFQFTGSTIKFQVGAAGPVVAKNAAQVKFKPVETSAPYATLEGDYDFRVKSVITDADWDAYFQSTDDGDDTNNATNCITSVGIVAFRGTTGFDVDTAKAAVSGGTYTAGYSVAQTDYVQKASADADAYFGAVIKQNKDTDTDVTYMAFVNYLDASGAAQTVFYETSFEALLATNYDTYSAGYLAGLNNGTITL